MPRNAESELVVNGGWNMPEWASEVDRASLIGMGSLERASLIRARFSSPLASGRRWLLSFVSFTLKLPL